MGGEASGLAVARAPPGTFTDWVAGSGVADLAAEWQAAVSFRPLIEAEAGGTPDQVPAAYAALSPLGQVPAIAAQHLHRAYLVHGAADTVVPAEQSTRLADALAQAGVPATHVLVASEPGAWACAPLLAACAPLPAPDAPASHEAGLSKVSLDLVRGLAAGQPEPRQPFQRILVEGATGASVTA
jgi:dienelactone hydrolase